MSPPPSAVTTAAAAARGGGRVLQEGGGEGGGDGGGGHGRWRAAGVQPVVAGYNCYTPPSLLDPMERREGKEKKMSHLQVIMSLATLFGGCRFIGHRASHSPSGDSGGYR
uniref:Uncharacterized protein n=1 Tax=Oryza glaberrima TaxID=4538 RepID=I1Q9K9_ORYGL